MRKLIFIGFFGLFASGIFSQNLIQQPADIKPQEPYENIAKTGLFAGEEVTSVVLWIKEGVKPHYHALHDEHVIVLKGKAEMHLGDQLLNIKKGDVIFIPKGTIHDVKVTSKVLKVISIQAPKFEGKDRIFVD